MVIRGSTARREGSGEKAPILREVVVEGADTVRPVGLLERREAARDADAPRGPRGLRGARGAARGGHEPPHLSTTICRNLSINFICATASERAQSCYMSW